jgi:uncharacterized metal-binding protein YceD (DUF177 family)
MMTAQGQSLPGFSHVIDISAISSEGVSMQIDAGDTERKAIAERLGIPALDRLSGAFEVTPVAGGANLRLDLIAVAHRVCVVSLEPMIEEISETICMKFRRDIVEDDEIDDVDEIIEPLDGDEIDLGELLIQYAALALDPYPRKPGAAAALESCRDATPASPFAALKGLADRDP